ncbi:hypothetical protein Tco_1057653 [Tanacetum coccineum]|uniref:Polyprotein n=1 Tax=Tanacetum coccineum TaxID=301880 RepID=A0ABQ5H692_9ASTR
MGMCTLYARRETFTPLTKTPKEILAMESVNFPPLPPLIGTLEKQNLNKFCNYHRDKGHNTNDYYHLKKQIEEAVASRKLAHLVKDIRQGNQRNRSHRRRGVKVINMVGSGGYRRRPYEMAEPRVMEEIVFSAIFGDNLTDTSIILEATIEGFRVRRIYIDGGSSSEFMYGQCFRSFDAHTKSNLRKSNAPFVGVSREIYHPLGLVDLQVTMGNQGEERPSYWNLLL